MISKSIIKKKLKHIASLSQGLIKTPNYILAWIKMHVKAQTAIYHILSTIKFKTPKCQCSPISIVRFITKARLLPLPTVRPCLKTMESWQITQSMGRTNQPSSLSKGKPVHIGIQNVTNGWGDPKFFALRFFFNHVSRYHAHDTVLA